MPPPQSSREVLLTELRWLDALAPTQREALSKRAAMAAGWIALVDRDSRFKEQVAWQRAGVSHFFHKPLDADRLAALLEDIHDRLDGPPARAILVDDDEHSLSYYSAVLKDAGVEVMALQDPLLVLEAMEDFKPDLLLLDIDMPGCRGTELATIVRQRPEYARLPAIFLTAMEGMQDKLLAREAAAEDYLNKPVALDLLVAAVKSHTLRYRSMQRSDAWRRQQEKQSQEAIRISEERLRRGQSYANIGTWDWNIQTGNLFWSERIPVLFGHPAGELVTTIENLLNALHPGDRQSVLDAINASVERDVPYEIEHRVILPDGTVRWLLEKGAVVRDAAGKPLQMLGVVQDIDDRKRAEQLSVAARKEAEQANQAKSDFLSRMSHEIRT
ncbi:MAG: response regulator, partial [Pseudomonadota bacterium]